MYFKFRQYQTTFILSVLLNGLFLPAFSMADVVVIVNPSNTAIIDKDAVKKIFMGRVKTFSNGEKAIPIEVETGDLRKVFLQKFLQKDPSAIDSYWSRMLFSGDGTPPKTYATEEDIKQLVANNPNTIGYIDSSLVDKTVKVVLK